MMQATEALELFFPLVSGGVAEGPRVRVLKRKKDLRSVQREVRGLQVREFLQLPSTGGGFLLASLGSHHSFTSALADLPISRHRWKAARRLLGILSRIGLHRHLPLPRFFVVLPVGTGPDGPDYSLQTGVPGGGQKLIVREHGRGRGDSAIWKVGRTGLPAQLVEAEARALVWLGEQGLSGELSPQLLDSGKGPDASWVRMQALLGKRPGDEIREGVDAFLKHLASMASTRVEVGKSPWFHRVQARLADIEEAAPVIAALCREALGRVLELAAGMELRFHPAHGDFTPWNTRIDASRLQAFDWEFFNADAPALFDRFHWIVQTGVLVQRKSCEEIYPQALRLTAEGTETEREIQLLFAMYLIDVLIRDEWIFKHGRPKFPQLQWLITARTALLDRALGA